MNTLPTKQEPPVVEPEPIPTWRDLSDRFRDVVKDFVEEGKAIERNLEPRMLPALKRLKLEIEKLIARLEARVAKKTP
jgi:hypothetical protein